MKLTKLIIVVLYITVSNGEYFNSMQFPRSLLRKIFEVTKERALERMKHEEHAKMKEPLFRNKGN